VHLLAFTARRTVEAAAAAHALRPDWGVAIALADECRGDDEEEQRLLDEAPFGIYVGARLLVELATWFPTRVHPDDVDAQVAQLRAPPPPNTVHVVARLGGCALTVPATIDTMLFERAHQEHLEQHAKEFKAETLFEVAKRRLQCRAMDAAPGDVFVLTEPQDPVADEVAQRGGCVLMHQEGLFLALLAAEAAVEILPLGRLQDDEAVRLVRKLTTRSTAKVMVVIAYQGHIATVTLARHP
jgi:hypothetical protein